MNENIQKSLVMGASIMVTIGIISIGLMIFSQGTSLVKESSKSMVDLTQELNANRYMAYEDAIVSGFEVINAINIFASDTFKINVNGNADTEYEYTYSNNYGTEDNEDIISTNNMYEGKLNLDSNGNVTAITFSQL